MDIFGSKTETVVLTDEERNNPELIKERESYKDSPVSVYYGSKKEGMENACETCKKVSVCPNYKEVVYKETMLKEMTKNIKNIKGFTRDEVEKLKNNVFIVIKCIDKEE